MNRDKILSLCKKSKKFVTYIQTKNTQWLGNGKAFYCMGDSENLTAEYLTAAAGLKVTDVINTSFLLLNFDFSEDYNFADQDTTEALFFRYHIDVKIDGEEYLVFESERGTVFIHQDILSPFKADTSEVYSRINENSGEIYYVVKEGMVVVAVIFEDNSQIHIHNLNALRNIALGVESQYRRLAEREKECSNEEKKSD